MRRVAVPTSTSLIQGPAREPLSQDEAKLQLRLSTGSNSLNRLIDLWIPAARQHFEEQTGRQCITATWEYWLAGFPIGNIIELPRPPLQDVLSVVYDDGAGDEQTLDADTYTVEKPAGAYANPGRIVLAGSAMWPSTVADDRFSVRVRFTAGYGDNPEAVPPLVRASLLFLVGHFHKNAEEVVTPQGNSPVTLPIGATKMIEAFKYSALLIHPLERYACR
jgi:uncharacterized phiE125 gp8 family phage protein